MYKLGEGTTRPTSPLHFRKVNSEVLLTNTEKQKQSNWIEPNRHLLRGLHL